MRGVAISIISAGLLAAAAPVAAANRHHARRRPTLCTPATAPGATPARSYRTTLAADASGQVYSLGSGPPPRPNASGVIEQRREIYACAYGHRGAYDLGPLAFVEPNKYFNGGTWGDRRVTLAGTVVGFESFSVPASGVATWGITTRDIRTGHTLHHEPTGTYSRPIGEPEQEYGNGPVTALLVANDGSAAWITSVAAGEGTYQLHVCDAEGGRIAASGADIDPNSLALAGNRLYWIQAAAPHAMALS